MHKLGVFLHNRGKYDEAEQVLREVVDLRAQLHGSESPELAESLSALALTLAHKGGLEEANNID
ncbi:MAG: Tetratricopeptide repeat [Pseudomonadota bacterium]